MSDTYQAEATATASEAPPPIERGTTEEMIRESVGELNKKREQEGTLGHDEVIERKWGGDDNEPVKLRDAAGRSAKRLS